MVDQERVRLMIRLARYENGEGVEDFRIRKYYRSDYTALQLIKTWILTTLGYGLLLGLIIAGNVEFLLDNIDSMNLRVLFSWILIGYIVLIGAYFAAVYISSVIRYNRAKRNVKEYLTALMDLQKGGVDGVLIDLVVAEYRIAGLGDDSLIVIDSLEDDLYGIGFRKEDVALRDKVDEILTEMEADGTIEEISTEWFGKNISIIGAAAE